MEAVSVFNRPDVGCGVLLAEQGQECVQLFCTLLLFRAKSAETIVLRDVVFHALDLFMQLAVDSANRYQETPLPFKELCFLAVERLNVEQALGIDDLA